LRLRNSRGLGQALFKLNEIAITQMRTNLQHSKSQSDDFTEKNLRSQIICNSLRSWVHDGSHYAHDDLYVSIDDSMVESYFKVFKAIFVKARHIDHHRVMMGDPFVEEPTSLTN
jgi:wobble nucleotide-excising tRNase